MKKWMTLLSWSACVDIKIEACMLDEVIGIVKDKDAKIPIPDTREYIDNS